MTYFPTRYAAKRAYPNAIIRKVISNRAGGNKGSYVAFNDYTTYEQWKRAGFVI